jgi:hypothetical protein
LQDDLLMGLRSKDKAWMVAQHQLLSLHQAQIS